MSDNGWSWPVSWCVSTRLVLVGLGPADVARVRRLRRQCSLSTPKPTSRRKGFWSAGAQRFLPASDSSGSSEGGLLGAGGSRMKLRRRGLPQPRNWRTSLSPRRRKTRRRRSQTRRNHLTETNTRVFGCSISKISSSISTSARPLSRPRMEKHHPQPASRHPNTHGTPATKTADSPLH